MANAVAADLTTTNIDIMSSRLMEFKWPLVVSLAFGNSNGHWNLGIQVVPRVWEFKWSLTFWEFKWSLEFGNSSGP